MKMEKKREGKQVNKQKFQKKKQQSTNYKKLNEGIPLFIQSDYPKILNLTMEIVNKYEDLNQDKDIIVSQKQTEKQQQLSENTGKLQDNLEDSHQMYDIAEFLKILVPKMLQSNQVKFWIKGINYITYQTLKCIELQSLERMEIVFNAINQFLNKEQHFLIIEGVIRIWVQIFPQKRIVGNKIFKNQIQIMLPLLKSCIGSNNQKVRGSAVHLAAMIRIYYGWDFIQETVKYMSISQKRQFFEIACVNDFGENFVQEQAIKANKQQQISGLSKLQKGVMAAKFNQEVQNMQFREQKHFFEAFKDMAYRNFCYSDEEYNTFMFQKYNFILFFNKDVHFDLIQDALLAYIQKIDLNWFKENYSQDEIVNLIDKIVLKMYDGKKKLSQLSMQLLNTFFELGFNVEVLDAIQKGLKSFLIKPINGCLLALINLLQNWGFQRLDKMDRFLSEIDKFATHNNKLVRQATLDLFVEIYRWIGDELVPYMKRIKEQQRFELNIIFRDLPRDNVHPLKASTNQIEQNINESTNKQSVIQQNTGQNQDQNNNNSNEQQEQERQQKVQKSQVDNQNSQEIQLEGQNNEDIQLLIDSFYKNKSFSNIDNEKNFIQKMIDYSLKDEQTFLENSLDICEEMFKKIYNKQLNEETFQQLYKCFMTYVLSENYLALKYQFFKHFIKQFLKKDEDIAIQTKIFNSFEKYLDQDSELKLYEQFYIDLSEELFVICDNQERAKEKFDLKTLGVNVVSKVIFVYGEKSMEEVTKNLKRETKQIKRNLEKYEFIKKTKQYQQQQKNSQVQQKQEEEGDLQADIKETHDDEI